jgi:hypothetical protein
MNKTMTRAALFALVLAISGLASTPRAHAGEASGFGLDVLVDGAGRPEYHGRGTVYVEAIRGREYSLRISNPTAYRVAVALSVDGLNTIDARHTDARSAAKWVLGPYESAVISGWQVNDSTARRFFFTGEKRSYGAALGQTANLGVIEAVFFREVRPRVYERWEGAELNAPPPPRSEAQSRKDAAGSAAQPAPAPALSDDFAATGMGGRTRHEVSTVDLDLESSPAASIRLRYEFRPELVRLGVLPRGESPRQRREKAKGFSYCPEP